MPAFRMMLLSCLFVLPSFSLADGPKDNLVDQVRPIPPVGIEVDDADQQELAEGVEQLVQKVAALRKSKSELVQRLLPDVEIFPRAIDQAIRYQTIYHARDIKAAKELLQIGNERAEQLKAGQAPWLEETGLVVRGFRSKLDGTVQPYGLVIPENYTAKTAGRYRCDFWFHGRGERSLELQFIARRLRDRGIYQPADTIVLHPFARYSNGNKLAGEVDCLEAIEHVKANYRVDENRIGVRGFSMGGAACWHIAAHYADRWFAANPGAGFSETPLFLKSFQQETLNPSWYEEKLWRLYDCQGWTINFRHLPTIAYSGEIDKQKQAADVMAEAFAENGMHLTHIIGPDTAHKIHLESRKIIEQKMDSIAVKGIQRFPQTVELVTCTLKYNRMHWVTIHGLKEHWEWAKVKATCKPENTIHIENEGVTGLTLEFPAGESLIGRGEVKLLLTPFSQPNTSQPMQVITVPGMQSDGSWKVQLYHDGNQWQVGAPQTDGLRKVHDLQGPIDDALMQPFLFVRPTGKAFHQSVANWTDRELTHAIEHWRSQMRGEVRIKNDVEVTEQDIANYNLILWGDPQSNQLIAKVIDQLPAKWTGDQLQMGKAFPAETSVLAMVYPNPLNTKRYLVFNSSFTYREYDYLNNARQVPKLPDWAIIDATQGANARQPGNVLEANFFDEQWQLKP